MLSTSAAFAAYPGLSFRGSVQHASSTAASRCNIEPRCDMLCNYLSVTTTSSAKDNVLTGLSCGLLAAAGSVAGSHNTRRSRTARLAGFDASNSLGVLAPVDYWDPCGLMKDGSGNWKDEATFQKYRTAELKHGRVAMLATTGILTATVWKFPGWEGVPNGFAAFSQAQGGAGFGLIVILAAFFEITTPDGNFPDPLGVGSYKKWGYNDDMKNKELNHGRMAMAAIITMFLWESGTGETPAVLLQTTFGERGPNPISGPVFAMIAAVILLLPTTPYGTSKPLTKTYDGVPSDAISAAVSWLSTADFAKGDIPAVRVRKALPKV